MMTRAERAELRNERQNDEAIRRAMARADKQPQRAVGKVGKGQRIDHQANVGRDLAGVDNVSRAGAAAAVKEARQAEKASAPGRGMELER